MGKKDDFLDELVDAIAIKVTNSSLMQTSVARAVKTNPKLLSIVVERIEPMYLSQEIARQIVHAKDKGSLNAHTATMYTTIMREARLQAVDIVAKKLAEDTLNA